MSAHTFGAEIEKPIANRQTGETHSLSQQWFQRIEQAAHKTGHEVHTKHSDLKPDILLGVQHPDIGEIGLDNGFNNQETASVVVHADTVESGLRQLQTILEADLNLVQTAAQAEEATVINMSNHPTATRDEATYQSTVAPKSLYKILRRRGWDHTAGINANAQNSPSTGVEPHNAVKAVNTIIGVSPALIALYANSPFQEGEVTGYQENRLRMWNRMMQNSQSEGDRRVSRFPARPFNSLADYFTWMHGPDTNLMFIVASGADGNYKTFGDRAIRIDGDPSVLEYLGQSTASGTFFESGAPTTVEPILSDMETLQFMQFTDARIRYTLNANKINRQTFLEAHKDDALEEIFAQGGANAMWIEGRAPGTNFPDQELWDIDANIARNIVISPSAIQAGLLNNLDKANDFIHEHNWQQLGALRESATQFGMKGSAGDLTIQKFTEQVLELAAEGLGSEVHHMLAYPLYVTETGNNGATRALKQRDNGHSLNEIAIMRQVVTK